MTMELLKSKDWSEDYIMQNVSNEMVATIQSIAHSVDLNKYESILFFGTTAQKKLVQFSQLMLKFTQKNDQINMSTTMENLSSLIESIQLDDLIPKEQPWYKKILPVFQTSISEKLSNFRQTNAQMDRLMIMLERNKIILMKDIEMLNNLYKQNVEYVDTLVHHIAAAKQLLKNTVIDNEQLLVQEVDNIDWKKEKQRNDIIDALEMLQARIYDLEMSREVGKQMLAQTEMLLASNKVLVEKIHSSLLTTIPIWRNQFSIAISTLRAKQTTELNDRMNHLQKQLKQQELQLGNTDLRSLNLEELRALHRKLSSVITETVQLQLESDEAKKTINQSFDTYEKQLIHRIENGEKNVLNN